MTDASHPSDVLVAPDRFPPDYAQIVLTGPAGDIEALTDLPDVADAGATAIVCHCLDGVGTMHNKVVHIIERAFRELGAATVRFNFRGVGASAGAHDGGIGETEDLLAVAEWVRRVRPDTELLLGGYGFGAYVALRACQKLPVSHLVTVTPPVEQYDFAALPRAAAPWLLVQGDDDGEVNPDAVYAWAEGLEEPPQLLRMEGADHTFHRRLMDLRGAIKNGIRRQQRNQDSTDG